jgi:hypothetical protein
MLYVDFSSLDIHKQHDLVFHNINKDCLYVVITFFFNEGFESCLINLHGLSFAVDKIGWGGMEAMKILFTGDGSHVENTLCGGHFGHFHDMYVMYIFAKLVLLNFGFHFWCLGMIF